MRLLKQSWKDWINLQRLVPIATAIVAFFCIIAANLGLLVLSVPEQLMLTILGLLAIDALVGRMQILERIRQRLDILTGDAELYPIVVPEEGTLWGASFDDALRGATEVFVSGGSLHGLMSRQEESLRRWLSQTKDARLLLILEDPATAGESNTPVYVSAIDRDSYVHHIEESLKTASRLGNDFPLGVRVRLTKEVPSQTIFMIDRSKARVSLNLYLGRAGEQRPSFDLSKSKHRTMFKLFEDRYRIKLWNASDDWPFTDDH